MLPTPALKVCLNAPEPLTPFWGSLEKLQQGQPPLFLRGLRANLGDLLGTIVIVLRCLHAVAEVSKEL